MYVFVSGNHTHIHIDLIAPVFLSILFFFVSISKFCLSILSIFQMGKINTESIFVRFDYHISRVYLFKTNLKEHGANWESV